MPFKWADPRQQILSQVIFRPRRDTPHLIGPCWIWTGQRNNSGYGKVTVVHPNGKRQNMLAHKRSLQVFKGERPASRRTRSTERQGLHLCNVKHCVSPEHLKIGTAAENNQQTVKDGRHDPYSGARARRGG